MKIAKNLPCFLWCWPWVTENKTKQKANQYSWTILKLKFKFSQPSTLKFTTTKFCHVWFGWKVGFWRWKSTCGRKRTAPTQKQRPSSSLPTTAERDLVSAKLSFTLTLSSLWAPGAPWFRQIRKGVTVLKRGDTVAHWHSAWWPASRQTAN